MTANGYGVFLGGEGMIKNVLELVVMFAQLSDYIKNH